MPKNDDEIKHNLFMAGRTFGMQSRRYFLKAISSASGNNKKSLEALYGLLYALNSPTRKEKG